MPTSILKVFYKGNALSIVQMGTAHHAVLSANGHRLGETTPLQTRLLATDAQQSTVLGLSDSRTTLAYSPYGNDDCPTDTPVVSRFTGQPWLPSAVGYLLGNGHRLFNPALMRFYSADSWSPFEEGGINAYAYCENDPVNRSDPSGRYSIFKLLTGGYRPKTIIANAMGESPSLTKRQYRIARKYLKAQKSKATIKSASLDSTFQKRDAERLERLALLESRVKRLIPDDPTAQKIRYVDPESSWESLHKRFNALKIADGNGAHETWPGAFVLPAKPSMTLPKRNAFSEAYLAFTGNYIDKEVNKLRTS
ncbi:RHS repeat-associated core domain-containing protein [Pseudomonas entomophila]|uniref:RHS repeat-associated core domain-containing protein n=1 Tax=Pseudomonas entomophila TaxID=312306 RepID=UPI003EB7C0EC